MLVYVNHADYISRDKSDMKERKNISRLQVQYIIKKFRIRITGTFEVRSSGLVDIKGSLKLTGNKIFRLPLKFGNVTGDFNCKGNGLKTLKGSPRFVGGSFNCSDNQLTTLVEGPDYVGVNYFCQDNKLTSLNGCPVEIVGEFNCAVNSLKSLKYGPKRVGKSFYAHHNMLKTLISSPAFVGGSFHVAANLLFNLEDCPDIIGLDFHLDCWIPSLYMGLKNCHVGGVKIECLERMDNNSSSILPELILSNQKSLTIQFKYARYLEIWDINGFLNFENLNDILFDIDQGLM